MLSRENIYKRLNVLHEEIHKLELEMISTPVNKPSRNMWFEKETDRLQWCINQRYQEIKQLESYLVKDINTKTLHLTVTYELDLDYEDILRNGIRGVSL